MPALDFQGDTAFGPWGAPYQKTIETNGVKVTYVMPDVDYIDGMCEDDWYGIYCEQSERYAQVEMPPDTAPVARFFNTSGNLIAKSSGENEDRSKCEIEPVGYSWDFSGSTKRVNENSSFAEQSGSFTDNRLLFTLHPSFTPPSDWVNRVKSDKDVNVTIDSPISGNFCGGDTAEVEFTLEAFTVSDKVSGTLTVTNDLTGKTVSEDVTIEGSQSFTKSVGIPEGTIVSNSNIITVEFN